MTQASVIPSSFFHRGVQSLVVFLFCMASVFTWSVARAQGSALVLYDSAGPFGIGGKEHALLVGNLAGHFGVSVTRKPVTEYQAGEVDQHRATFYIGSTYNESDYYPAGSAQRTAYDAFLRDVATSDATIVWHNYNIWKMAWAWDPSWGGVSFAERFGFTVDGTQIGMFNRVTYKGTTLDKGVVKWANPGATLAGCASEGGTSHACSLEIVRTTIQDPTKATVLAQTSSTLTPSSGTPPWAIQSGRFFFIADQPTSYISEEDRYLAYSDILHEVFQSGVGQQPLRAIVRFEDISAGTLDSDFKAATDYLVSQNIKFAVATVPMYEDRLGIFNGGVAQRIPLSSSATGLRLKDLHEQGHANIVTHGYSHQLGALRNPYNGLTGDDFEFFRVTINTDNSLNFLGPVPGDSQAWGLRRIRAGNGILRRLGLKPFAWEAPHYTASDADYRGIRRDYQHHYGRLIYFPEPVTQPNRFIGQFFPYVVNDAYGYTVLPENIGNIEPNPIAGYRSLYPADLIRHADVLKRVVRDPIASFYYHPYLGTAYLEQVVEGLRANGWQFVEPCSVVGNCP